MGFPALGRKAGSCQLRRGERFSPDKGRQRRYCPIVSATEILNELPKLTEAELRLVRQRLSELAAQGDDVELCNQAALEGALMLDRMEHDDAPPESR